MIHHEIRSVMRDWGDPGDPYGSVMSSWFALCDALYCHGDDIPSSWQYRPGIGMSTEALEEDEFEQSRWLYDLLEDGAVTASDLEQAGNVLERAYSILVTMGRDY